MRRWIAHYGEATARAIAIAHAQEPALDLTVKSDPQAWAARLDGRVLPTGSVRIIAHGPVSQLAGFAEGAWWVQDAAAALAGAAARRRARQVRRRPLRRPRRQDRATCACRRAGRRGRSLATPPRAPARKSRAAQARGRNRRRRRHRMAGRAVRRRAARRAVLLDRHDPPASRHALAQVRGRPRGARRPCSARCSTTRWNCSSPAARWSTAPVRSSPRKASTRSRRCSRAIRDLRRRPIRRERDRRACRTAHRPRAICARCPAICLIRTRAWAGSTASTPPGSRKKGDFAEGSAPVGPCLHLRYMCDGGGNAADAPCREASASMVGVSIAERAKLSLLLARRGMRNAVGRLRGHPLIRWNVLPRKTDRLLIAPQDLRTADGTRASEIYAGRFAFAGKVVICDGRSPFEIIAAVGRMGRQACSASAGCAICAPPNPASPAPMPARWWTNGSRCRAPGIRSAGSRRCWRAASSPGSPRRR